MSAYIKEALAIDIDLDKEYSPSQNTKRFQQTKNPDECVLEYFMKVTSEQTERARSKYNVRLNISYDDNVAGDNKLLDIYYKDVEEGAPMFVYIHGGYFQALDKNTGGSFVEPVVELGYRVVVVDYNLCPTVTLETLGKEVSDFYEWLYQYALKTKCSKIVFCGHSAGAYLCTLLFRRRFVSEAKAQDITFSFFLISGIYDLRELWLLESVNPNNIFSLDEMAAERLSPICWLFKQTPEVTNVDIHVLVAENDSKTFIGQSLKFAEKVKETGFLNVHFKVFEEYDHFSIIEEVTKMGSAINCYLLEHLN